MQHSTCMRHPLAELSPRPAFPATLPPTRCSYSVQTYAFNPGSPARSPLSNDYTFTTPE